MPAAPGATPRKMFPPPITTPISTPMRATCAISPTIVSIVLRLIPNASSPIRASPESLRRIRLYLGARNPPRSVRLARLRHHFGGEVFRLLLDSFADDEEGIVVDLRFLGAQHFFHRL